MNIGDIIKIRRGELHLTLEEIGDFVGVGKSTVKKWENGYIENMKRDKISLLSQILQLNPVTFIIGEVVYLDTEDFSKQTDSKDEQELLRKYRELNQLGKDKAKEYIQDLVDMDKYQKNKTAQ